MDASHVTSLTLIEVAVATISIGIILGYFAYQSNKNRKKKKSRRS
jgi:hypothetical protein